MGEGKVFEAAVALVVVVASFMYVYDALTRYTKTDVLIAVLIFGVGLAYLFNNVKK